MNKKGFTFVELLAVIVIIGILSTVAIGGVSRHLEKSRTEAFNTMRVSACDAIQNKILQEKIVCNMSYGNKTAPYDKVNRTGFNCCFDLADLQEELYLEPLKDPSDDDHICTGIVYVDSLEQAGNFYEVDEYKIKVQLTCEGFSTLRTDGSLRDSADCSNLATRDFK